MSRQFRRSLFFSTLILVLSLGWEAAEQSTPPTFGKIYLRENLLLVSDLTKGIRLLDIANPGTPSYIGLLGIEGNHDMAIASSDGDNQLNLYADSYAHLLVYDISNPLQPRVIDTLYNIFQNAAGIGWGDPMPRIPSPSLDRVGGVSGCTGCSENVVYVARDDSRGPWLGGGFENAGSRGSGRGGSMARFAVVDDYLYCIDYTQLYVFEIDNPAAPRLVSRVNIGWGIETLFPYQDYLFIGGQNGMFIYSRKNPELPEYVSTFQHIRACDPVVVEDSIAYVTLRGGTRCGQVVSALHVVDVKNLFNPKILNSYPLPQPMGLDVRWKIAYVCDDSAGVYILNVIDPNNIRELARISEQFGYDTILSNWLLIVASRNSISFYNVANPQSPIFLSRYGG